VVDRRLGRIMADQHERGTANRLLFSSGKTANDTPRQNALSCPNIPE
jgi:hypothetical protein